MRAGTLPGLALSLSVGLLVLFAAQYPLSTTYPMGGDAPPYIISALRVFNPPSDSTPITPIAGSWYPLAHILFLPMAILPLDWPMRFIVWAALAQIASGLTLGWLLYRLDSWRSAAMGIALWALTPIVATSHFEDGTIAQLWSYSFVFLCLERYVNNRPIGAVIFFLMTLVTHPITGLALIIAFTVSTVSLSALPFRLSVEVQRTRHWMMSACFASILITLFLLTTRLGVLNAIERESASYTPLHYIDGIFKPVLFLLPIGLIMLAQRLQSRPAALSAVFTVMTVFGVIAFNGLFNINGWTKRLNPLFVIVIVLAAAFAWPRLMNLVRSRRLGQTVFTMLMMTILSLSVWQYNAIIYQHYESPSRYMRIHPKEIAAMQWLADHAPPNSTIISTSANRHTEWVPILTPHTWIPVESDFATICTPQHTRIMQCPNSTYALFLLKREGIPKIFMTEPQTYPIVFENSAAAIIRIR